MTDVVLFHHAQGLTEGMRGFADTLRARGHHVTTPDLYAGHTFGTLDEGLAYARETGFGTIVERGLQAARNLPGTVVYGGFSLGVIPAQRLAQTTPDARGALLIDGCLPVSEFGEKWPENVPVQIHGMADDQFFAEDAEAARELAESTERAELFLYPGDKHLFADSSLPSYDAVAASLLTQRVAAFLEGL